MLQNIKKDYLFFIFLLLQAALWTQLKFIKPDMAVLPDLPTETSIKALSFGDEQFYFRALSFNLQNAGDTFGRITPLKDYDYEKLGSWFGILDLLDSTSNFVPSMAAYYYSNTQNKPDVRYVVDYLVKHADKDPYNKWWWYAQAIHSAKNKLGDKKLALEIAYKLAASPNPNIPMWARQMPAFILEDLGEKEEAIMIAKDIIDRYEDMPESELNFMYYFIKERLEKMESGELK